MTPTPIILQLEEPPEGVALVFLLALFFLGNYFAGRFYNIHRSRKLTALGRRALSDLDDRPKIRSSGGKSIVFTGTPKSPPISQYTLTILLLGRENILNWAIARMAGRGDMAIFMAKLHRRPRLQFDAIRRGTPPHRALLRSTMRGAVREVDALVVREVEGDSNEANAILSTISRQPHIWTFSVRRRAPEVVVNMAVEGMTEGQFRDAIKTLMVACEFLCRP